MGVELITEAKERINELRDTYGYSWREIAATGEFGGVSHTTLRDIANGHNPGARVTKKMGIRKQPYYTLAFRFRSRADFERARAAVDVGGDRTATLLEMIDKETTE